MASAAPPAVSASPSKAPAAVSTTTTAFKAPAAVSSSASKAPVAVSSSVTATSRSAGSSWGDDALLLKAIDTFERQAGDVRDRERGPEKEGHSDTPQKPLTETCPPLPAAGGGDQRTGADVTGEAVQPCQTTVTSVAEAAQHDVKFEGWQKLWESGPNGLPKEDLKWLKEDDERGLFQSAVSFTDKHGKQKWRRVLKDDRMWFYPPELPGVVGGRVPSADSFFYSRVFFWRPVGLWQYSLRCPRPNCPARDKKEAFLYRCGYSKTVRQICDISGWYSMLTEVLACNACRKAASESEDHAIGRFLSWEEGILRQLTPAHRAVFPAVLTLRHGVDKAVISLMRDRTEGNTMTKVWRQVMESHSERYLQRLDLYTTLLTQYNQAGKITSHFTPVFQRAPKRREPPCPKLLRKAFLIAETDNIEDYRTQIMSTFGKVLKYDSTKKICKKLSGEGKGTAEWCTNVANEQGQILISVLTCEESLDKMRPMAEGLMARYERAGEAPPQLMYVHRGCCRVLGVSSVEQLFSGWADGGMLVRLDIFHWLHRFDAALRTNQHPKYALFKSALSAAVFSYNRDDMALLLQAIRAGHPTKYSSLTDAELMETRVTKYDLSHYVRRTTVGAQETFMRVQSVIDILKGRAGMDENQVHLFKDEAAVDHVWENQQKHLECIQDPPGRNMYTTKKHVIRNGVRLPYYVTVRGSNSLEGFHSFLPSMIPGPHCAAVPFQVYLLAGIARWNSDRESASVRGQKGRRHMMYLSPLVHRLNKRCQELFGDVEEVNYRPPVPAGDERIGLEYLFAQSSEPFNAPDHYSQARQTLQEAEDEGDDVPADREDPVDEEEDADAGYTSDGEGETRTLLRKTVSISLTDQAVAAELDPCVEDVCGPSHLPGYEHVEELSKVLVDIALEEGKLAISNSTRQKVITAWNKLELHDRNIQQFDSLYSARWGNALFSRTSGDAAESALVQKLKFSKWYSVAHLLDSRKNRLMYCLIKQLWLHPSCGGKARGSPLQHQVTKMYQRVQQRVTVDDRELSKLGIPILKINSKCVSEFIHRQEALSARNVTDQGLAILRRHHSIADAAQSAAPELPVERPHTSRPQVDYEVTPSLAGTRQLNRRVSHPVTILPKAPSVQSSQVVMPSRLPAVLFTLSPCAALSTPPTSSAALSMPSTSSAALTTLVPTSSFQPSLARSTIYKRKRAEREGWGPPRQMKVYICVLCGRPTQGHKKYKKKTFCEVSKSSPSKGFSGQTFETFTDFQKVVDRLSVTGL